MVYLLVLGWSITNLSYDLWGALVLLPPLSLLGVLGLRRMFPGDLRPIATIMSIGLGFKFLGAGARYWVGFEAYDGGIDAQRYHEFAVPLATGVWDGEIGVLDLLPEETGTPFMDGIVAIVYALSGASKLGGFLVFSWLAYWGTAWFVKAACVAVPGLMQRRYAVLCILAPSLVYWPSSIGKEAWMLLTLGFATYGIASLLARRGVAGPVAVTISGLVGAAMVRPHMSALWMIGVLLALMVLLFSRAGPDQKGSSASQRFIVIGVIGVAAVGLVLAAGQTLDYLNFGDDEAGGADTVTAIIDETTRRTVQAQSNFAPPSIENPANWPFAAVRTLTRPLLIEARGSGQLLSALEMTVLIGIALMSGRRLLNLPKLVITVPFMTFAMTVTFFGALAFTSFANLGVLTRQRALLFPFMLLLLCLPEPTKRVRRRRGGRPPSWFVAQPAKDLLPETVPTGSPPSDDRFDVPVSRSPTRLRSFAHLDRAIAIDNLASAGFAPPKRRGDDIDWGFDAQSSAPSAKLGPSSRRSQ